MDSLLSEKPLLHWEPGWWEIANLLCLATLIAITIFRREISCNHVYAAERAPSSGGSSSIGATTASLQESESNNVGTDDLSGCCYSRAFYILAAILNVLKWVLPKETVRKLWESLLSWWDAASELHRLDELLDGVESWPQLLYRCPPCDILVPQLTPTEPITTSIFSEAEDLPIDVLVHVASFLHPKDVLTFGCVNRQASEFVGTSKQTDVSNTLWQMMWYRDYAWIVLDWEIGRDAMMHSFQSLSQKDPFLVPSSIKDFEFHRDFYFRFGWCCLEYILAGHFSTDRCLVGLGGNIYDLTGFLPEHPGSPETLIIHAGCDASDTFSKVRHTVQARRRAQRQCIVVDMTRSQEGCGLRPTTHFPIGNSREHLPSCVDAVIPDARPTRHFNFGPQSLLDKFLSEERKQEKRKRLFTRKHPDILDSVHNYFDPFCGEWKLWFINTALSVVFDDY